ncbi:MAG: ComEC/Rec2 family competence protein [Ilumatobacteraceae bacterium]
MSRAYGTGDERSRHHVRDGDVLLIAAATVAGVLLGPGGLVAATLAVMRRRVGVALLCLITALAGWWAGAHAWAGAVPRHLGPFEGWARVATDPVTQGGATRLTLEVQGERFDAWVYGGRGAALLERQAGEEVRVRGERVPSTGDVRRARVRHVVGRFRLEWLADVRPGPPLARAGNRARTALRHSAEATMAPAEAALFTGLVIGDDSRQPAWMVDQFRAAGLSHLTAVSGQNVAFLLAAASPLLRRLRPWPRWAATVGLVGWFMSVTRFEPSVLRAGAMAVLASTAFVTGRDARPVRLVGLAVTVLVLVDPMLVWSVGFWLSVGATLGVCVVAPWWVARLPGPMWLRLSLGVTLGAQVGVALPSLLVFGRLPLLAPVANLAAVPVAGGVMLYGLPAGLAAAALPGPLARVAMVPAVIGTRWTATVAAVAAAVTPNGLWAVLGWLVLAVAVLVLVRRTRVPS